MMSKSFQSLCAELHSNIEEYAPYTPIQGNNEGVVRDQYGTVIANTYGHEGYAEAIARLFNAVAEVQATLLNRPKNNEPEDCDYFDENPW